MLVKGPEKRNFPITNGILLALTVFVIFIVPVSPKNYSTLLVSISFTGIFIFAVLSLKKNSRFLVVSAIILSVLIWVSIMVKLESLRIIIRSLQFIFFLFLVGGLIRQISSTTSVTGLVIIDSITGYLLLGLSFSLIVTIISNLIPGAYNIDFSGNAFLENQEGYRESIYYTFMTFTTTGYGDTVPVHPFAKSLATLISVSGQLYVAIIIAMLVGKYATTKNE